MDKIKNNGISSYDLFLELLYLKKDILCVYYFFCGSCFCMNISFFFILICSNLLVNFYVKIVERLCVLKIVKECEISFFCVRNRY